MGFTLKELHQIYNKEMKEAYKRVADVNYKFMEEMNKILEEKNLNELVLRKADNRVGEIWVGWDYYVNQPEVTFHPLTKKKEPSANGQTIYTFLKDFSFEDEYEPYTKIGNEA